MPFKQNNINPMMKVKITTIEKARDVSIVKLDELMGSLQIFELNITMNKK